jgi:uncharacterized protein (TIGR02172 family)
MQLPGVRLAIGFTAEIYAWKDGYVLKLFNPGKPRQMVELEARLARLVYASGLPAPQVGEVIELDGRFGLEYEWVEGNSMLQAVVEQPWKLRTYACQLAELHAGVHKMKLPEMPSMRERLRHKITHAPNLPERLRRLAIDAVTSMPDEDWLCHGDFHPGNILLTRRGPVIIDWIDASRGNPLMDVARSTLLFGGGGFPPGTTWILKVLRGLFYRHYLQHYKHLAPFSQQQLQGYLSLAAAARLDEGISFDEKWLLSVASRLT